MSTPLIALATNNGAVRETIHGVVTEYYRQKGILQPVAVATVPRAYSTHEGFVSIIEDARQNAEAARIQCGARVGIAGAFGDVTLRKDRSYIAKWRTFIVVATSADNLVACSPATNTYPLYLADAFSKVMENIIVRYAVGKPEPSEEDSAMAGTAIAGWTEMDFEAPHLEILWSH